MSKDKKLTSVRVTPDLFKKFKQECIEHKFSFQKLCDRAMYLYLTDEVFKSKIQHQKDVDL
jgi:hypothetical protein